MTIYSTNRRRKSLRESQQSWMIHFKAAYRAQLPMAFGVGTVVAAVAVYVLQDYVGLNAAIAMGALVLGAIPVVAIGPAMAGLEPYPTAAQHVKSNQVIDMHEAMKHQELETSGSKQQLTRG